MQLTPGDPIPLRLNLDPPAVKFVRAFVLDQSMNLIHTVNLSPPVDDVYFDSSLVMTEDKNLTVIYKVYDDSGYSVLSNYEEVSEVITKDEGGSGSVSVTFPVTNITGTVSSSEVVAGSVAENDGISAAVEETTEISQSVQESGNISSSGISGQEIAGSVNVSEEVDASLDKDD